LSRPLSNDRWLGFESPFCALPVAVDLDDGGVDHGVFHIWLVRDGLEQPFPDIRLHPIAKARIRAAPVAERRWQIAPGAARAGNPQHCLHKQPVILAAASGITEFAQTKRFHFRPLGVAQNESLHPKLESQPSSNGNPESQQALVHRLLRRGHDDPEREIANASAVLRIPYSCSLWRDQESGMARAAVASMSADRGKAWNATSAPPPAMP